ncbi:MAG: hypothetical protein AAF281_13620, partial [Pseudomonadota bacterium]
VLYFENTGRAGLSVSWDGPGIAGPALVEPAPMEGLTVIEGEPLDLALDFTAGGEGATLLLSGLPAGTTVEAGGTAYTADEDGAVAIEGGDVSPLSLTVPPETAGPVDALLTVTGPGGETEIPIAFEVVDPPWVTPEDDTQDSDAVYLNGFDQSGDASQDGPDAAQASDSDPQDDPVDAGAPAEPEPQPESDAYASMIG